MDKTTVNERLPFQFILFLLFIFMVYVRPYEMPALSFLIPLKPTKILLIIALIGYLLTTGIQAFVFRESSFRWFLLLQVLAIILLPFSIWASNSLTTFTETNLRIFITFYLLLIAADSWKKMSVLIKTIFISCACVAARVILAYQSGQYIYDFDGAKRVVGVGTLGSDNANDMALVLAMAVPIGLYFWHTRRGFKKIVSGTLTGLIIVALTVTGSRGGYLGLAAGLLIFYISLYRKQKLKFVFTMLLVGVIAMVALPSEYKNRFMTMFDESDYSHTNERYGRVAVWKRDWKAMLKRPIGYGLSNTTIAEGQEKAEEGMQGKWMVAHNSYLQIGLELGFLGLFCYLMFLLSGFGNIKKILILCRGPDLRQIEVYACALAGGLGSFLVSSFFLSQAYNWNFYIFLALTVGLKRIVEK